MLEKIGAYDCAKIEKAYGEELWKSYIALENSSLEEHDYGNLEATFYKHIKIADEEYRKRGEELRELLRNYCTDIYPELINIVEE